MIPRILEIQTPGKRLKVDRGALQVLDGKEVLSRVPIDDIEVLLLSNPAVTISGVVIERLLKRNVAIIFCDSTFCPSGTLIKLQRHREAGKRLELQAAASLPLKKRLWQQVVKAKVLNQAGLLKAFEIENEALTSLIKKVGSGDPGNIEAQAARRYWPLLLGDEFTRRRMAGGYNALLNYGYTVLRACVNRAVVAAGLHTAFAIHHSATGNPAALVDDLMEPYRPLIDLVVKQHAVWGLSDLTPEVKQELVAVLKADIIHKDGRAGALSSIQEVCYQLVSSFETGQASLMFPDLSLTFESLNAYMNEC